jgi:peptide/nickel transport system substrate-binding protein
MTSAADGTGRAGRGGTGGRARRSAVVTGAVVLVVALFAASCGTGGDGGDAAPPPGTFKANITNEDAGPPKAGGELSFGLNAETDGWDPTSNRWSSSGYIVGFSIFDPLAVFGADLKAHPYLAESFTSNADFTQWVIGVRDGVKFHDGTPVDAAAIKAALDKQKASPLTGATMDFVDNFAIDADGDIVVTMLKPWSTFPEILTAQAGVISAPSMATDPDANKHPVGSGPFVFGNWEQGASLTVTKNPDYWRAGYPYLDKIDFKVVSDISARGTALGSGTIDIFETNDAQQIIDFTDRAKSGDDVQIFTDQNGEGSKIFVGFNVSVPPFDDPIARQAVAYGSDVPTLSEQAYAGIFPPVTGVFSENSPYYVKPDNYPTYNPDKARELAQEYEAKYGKQLEFSTNITAAPEVQLVAQVLQAQLKEVGIKVDIVSKEQLTLISDALLGTYESTGFILFGSPSLDREYVFFASPAKPVGSLSLNFTRISDADNKPIVDAMDKARATDDEAVRKEQYAIVQQEMAKNLNFGFLVQQTSAVVYGKDINGVLEWKMPNESGGDGEQGIPTTSTMTFNVWKAA